MIFIYTRYVETTWYDSTMIFCFLFLVFGFFGFSCACDMWRLKTEENNVKNNNGYRKCALMCRRVHVCMWMDKWAWTVHTLNTFDSIDVCLCSVHAISAFFYYYYYWLVIFSPYICYISIFMYAPSTHTQIMTIDRQHFQCKIQNMSQCAPAYMLCVACNVWPAQRHTLPHAAIMCVLTIVHRARYSYFEL